LAFEMPGKVWKMPLCVVILVDIVLSLVKWSPIDRGSNSKILSSNT